MINQGAYSSSGGGCSGTSKKLPIRCLFWPNCEKGENCLHVHPSKPCLAFPQCPFGSKCHYIHPTCRYDGFCARPDCVFFHAVKKQSPQTSSVEPVQSSSTPATEAKTAEETVTPPVETISGSKEVVSTEIVSNSNAIQEETDSANDKKESNSSQQVVPNPNGNCLSSSKVLNNAISRNFLNSYSNSQSTSSLKYFSTSNSNKYTLINRNSITPSIPIVS